MATHARQQYFADENSLSKERREFSIADEIQEKIDSVEEGAQVNRIETVKVNGTALVPDTNKAVNVEVPDVIDNLYTVDSDNALSAKQGKLLYDYIQNIASRGRFLSNWNSATGLPTTNPSESPYPYKSGDYFVVSNVASGGGTNYRPDGSSYIIGQASTVVETEDVSVSDFYFYDGTNWLLLSNSGRQIAIDTSLSTTSTNPVENRVITNALNGKHPGAISNVAPSSPVEGMLWYDTANSAMKVWDGTAWQSVGGGSDIVYATQAEYNALLPGALTDNKHYFIYSTSGGGGWQPGVNTVMYFPFIDDQLDKVGSATINTTGTNETLGYTFSSSGEMVVASGSTACVFVAAWIKWNSSLDSVAQSVSSGTKGQILFNFEHSYSQYNRAFQIEQTGGGSIHSLSQNIVQGTRYHLAMGYDGTNVKCYINGSKVRDTTTTAKTGMSFRFGYGINETVSEYIGESVCWTDQEVADYFDQTKGDYGIS